MPATERIRREQHFHDQQALARAGTFAAQPQQLRFRDAEYLDHESWVRPAFDRLGDIEGRPVLDLGCGHGMAAVVFARRGAQVTACDLSAGYIAEARARARANEADVQCLLADAHRLPLATGSFAAVWGHAILHHLDVPKAAGELWRVLKPGGVAVLCEPWAGNPVARFARQWLPYAGKDHTADEEPLGQRHIRQLAAVFEHVHVEGFQILGGMRRIAGPAGWLAKLDRVDHQLCRRWPGLRRFGRYVVVTLRRGDGPLVAANRRP